MLEEQPTKVYEKLNKFTAGNVDTALPYRFEQSPLQLTVYVPFETKPIAKQLDIQFKGQFVSVKRKNSTDFILKGEISQPIKGNDSTWYIEDNNLVLVFDKKFKVWCSCVLKGDPEIDVSKIDAALLDGSDLSFEQQDQVKKLYQDAHVNIKRRDEMIEKRKQKEEEDKKAQII